MTDAHALTFDPPIYPIRIDMTATAIDIPGLDSLGMEVPLSKIEDELRLFFATDDTVTRASLLNLAVYSEKPDALAENPAIVRELTRDNACRSLLVLSVPDAERSVRAWVEAHCHLTEGGSKAACSEQVSFLLRGGSAGLVRNMIFAHTDSDLPLVLWWQGELSDVFEERLYGRIDRLVFDSAEWSSPAAPLLRISAAMEDQPRFVPHDLSFTRGSALRAALATCFDDIHLREALPRVETVEITHAPGAAGRTASRWLLAWLSHRLGWTLGKASSPGGHAFQDRLGRVVRSTFLADEALEAPLGRLRLTSGEFTFDATLTGDQHYWRLATQCGQTAKQETLFPARPGTPGALVGEILARAGRNHTMIEALPRLRELLVAE